jgi:site-specific recombinase XerD
VFDHLAAEYLGRLRKADYMESTLAHAGYHLSEFFWFLRESDVRHVRDLRPEHLTQFFDYLRARRVRRRGGSEGGGRLGNKSIHKVVQRVNHFLAFLHREELMAEDLSEVMVAPKVLPSLPFHIHSEEDMSRLLAAVDPRVEDGAVTATLLEIFYGTGMRLGEVARLNLYDLDFTEKTIFVRCGKGRIDRLVPMGNVVENALRTFIGGGRQRLPGAGGTLVFPGSRWGAMGKDQIRALLRAAQEKLGLTGTIHGFRHAFATHLLRDGANILYIQRLLGHKKPATTTIYTRVYPADLMAMMRQFHPRACVACPHLEMPVRRRPMKLPYLLKLKAQSRTLTDEERLRRIRPPGV